MTPKHMSAGRLRVHYMDICEEVDENRVKLPAKVWPHKKAACRGSSSWLGRAGCPVGERKGKQKAPEVGSSLFMKGPESQVWACP